MEHRWGQRAAVDVPVRLFCPPVGIGGGHIVNASVSGAFVQTFLALPLFTRVHVEIDLPWQPGPRRQQRITAFVVRSTAEGFGLEWQELAPRAISRIMALADAQTHVSVGTYVRPRHHHADTLRGETR